MNNQVIVPANYLETSQYTTEHVHSPVNGAHNSAVDR